MFINCQDAEVQRYIYYRQGGDGQVGHTETTYTPANATPTSLVEGA